MKVYLKGFLMGVADGVPGVSGGTIALVTGIYERMIQAIANINPSLAKSLAENFFELDTEGLKKEILSSDIAFLCILAGGIFSAIVLTLNIMSQLLTLFPVVVYSFFTGLILASGIILYRDIDMEESIVKFFAVIGLFMGIFSSGIGASALNNSLFVVYISGLLAVSTMILPGVSGSLVLVMMGQYAYLSKIISNLTQSIFNGFSSSIRSDAEILAIFILGGITGLFSVVKIIRAALNRYKQITMSFLISLMLGSSAAPIMQIQKAIEAQALSWINILPKFLGVSATAIILIFLIETRTEDRNIYG